MTSYVYRRRFLVVAHRTLKQARDARGLTQTALAELSGVDQRVISKIERGLVDDPHNSTVANLERALGLKRGVLVFGREALAS